ncbi:YjhB [Bacillus velezensis SQR9]|nr:YjhB [Bacillus velezensis SQR9]
MEPKWLEWAKQLQSAAQAGLAYSKDIYDIERFEEIRKISVDIMAHHTGTDKRIIKDVFAGDTGYPTPKVDIRAAVFKDQSILMVREKSDGRWALPGGWADIGISPGETAVKEVKEESGIEVKPVKLLAVMDKKCHSHPPSAAHVYKVFIKCEIIGGRIREGTETSAAGFLRKRNCRRYLKPAIQKVRLKRCLRISNIRTNPFILIKAAIRKKRGPEYNGGFN